MNVFFGLNGGKFCSIFSSRKCSLSNEHACRMTLVVLGEKFHFLSPKFDDGMMIQDALVVSRLRQGKAVSFPSFNSFSLRIP